MCFVVWNLRMINRNIELNQQKKIWQQIDANKKPLNLELNFIASHTVDGRNHAPVDR